MKKQKGVTLIALSVTIIVIMIIASVSINYGMDLVREAKVQDLKTNMLLIQAESKKGLEEVAFQTANLDKTKEDELNKINEIKAVNLKGEPLVGSEAESAAQETGAIVEGAGEYYYLDSIALREMGLEGLGTEKNGYFIVCYDIENIKVEVINTNGYNGKYTLTEINNI